MNNSKKGALSVNQQFQPPKAKQQNGTQSFQSHTKNKQMTDELVCNLCGMMFNSPIAAQQHFSGKKHKAALESTSVGQPSKIVQKNSDFHCSICDISLTSSNQLQQHNNGMKHKVNAGIVKDPPQWWKGLFLIPN